MERSPLSIELQNFWTTCLVVTNCNLKKPIVFGEKLNLLLGILERFLLFSDDFVSSEASVTWYLLFNLSNNPVYLFTSIEYSFCFPLLDFWAVLGYLFTWGIGIYSYTSFPLILSMGFWYWVVCCFFSVLQTL